jgi:hypothetical protein
MDFLNPCKIWLRVLAQGDTVTLYWNINHFYLFTKKKSYICKGIWTKIIIIDIVDLTIAFYFTFLRVRSIIKKNQMSFTDLYYTKNWFINCSVLFSLKDHLFLMSISVWLFYNNKWNIHLQENRIVIVCNQYRLRFVWNRNKVDMRYQFNNMGMSIFFVYQRWKESFTNTRLYAHTLDPAFRMSEHIGNRCKFPFFFFFFFYYLHFFFLRLVFLFLLFFSSHFFYYATKIDKGGNRSKRCCSFEWTWL